MREGVVRDCGEGGCGEGRGVVRGIKITRTHMYL